jgi:tetratricopeptide (TPR) repeat protein
MLIIDDLHWSDRPSLLLLQFLARELSGSRMLLVGTYRDVELNRQHPLSETLGELVRERLFERVLLRGLSLDDVNNFIEITSGIAPPRMLAKAVHTQTEGNPLFITEVVRLLAQEGEFTLQNLQERESWEIRVPEGVREVIGRRLNRLSQRCNDTLIVAAVIGREFTLQQLDGLMDDLNQDMLLDVLEEGLTARVIEEFSATVGLYQFTHALIQETLVSELTLTRRVRLHARISLSLELLYADDLESHAAELAHHFAQAEAATGSDKMITYSIMAGNRAMSKFAWEDAGYHFENALEAKSDQKVDRELADILYGLGTSLHSGLLTEFKYDQAHTFLKRAFSAYMEIGDLDRAVKSAQFPLIGPPGSMEVSLSLVEDALNVVPSDTSEEAVLLSRYAQLVASERGDVDAADQALNRAMSIASSYGDPLLESQVLSEAASVDGFSLRPHACIEKCNRALKLVSGNINTLFFSNALTYFTLCLITTGDATGAKPYVAALVEYAKHLQSPIQAWISQMG